MTTQSSKKKFALSMISFGLVQVLSQLASFFLIPLYTAKLSPADYGSIEYATTVCAVLMIVFSLQIQQSVVRFVADGQDEAQRKAIIDTGFSIYFLGLCAILFLILVPYFGFNYQFLFDSNYSHFFLWQIFYFILIYFNNFFYGILVWDSKSKTAATISIINLVATLISTILCVLVFDMRVKGYFIGLITGQLASMIFTFALSNLRLQFHINRALAVDLIRFSFPIIFSSIAFYSWFFLDRFLLNYYIDKNAIGIFAIALKFATPLYFITSIIETSLVPLIVKNPHNATSKDLLRNVYAIASIVAILYIQAVACFANELFGYIIDAKFKSGAAIIWYVCVSQLFAKWYFFNLGFAIHKKTIWFLVITLIGTAFNILFNLYAIPRYGLVGAAVATMLATFIFYSIINSASHALYPVQLRVYTFLAFVGLSGACNYCFLNTNLSFDYRAIVFVITVVLVFISYQSEIIKLIKAGYNQLVYKLKN